MKVVFTPTGRADLREVTHWYEKCRRGLGREFRLEVGAATKLIAKTPETWPSVSDIHRRFILHRFPYQIIYELTPQAVRIVAIFHSSRKPLSWRKRK